ncbi:MAG: acyl carrier protein [Acidobacteria bacterium]|nr:acyl carrier protein [Acidobacteriota bacterium]
MVNNIELQNSIIRILSEKIHVEVPSVETDLMESGLLDSLTLVELMASLEEKFGISISFDDIELDNFRSVDRIAEFVGNQTSMNQMMATKVEDGCDRLSGNRLGFGCSRFVNTKSTGYPESSLDVTCQRTVPDHNPCFYGNCILHVIYADWSI